MPPGVCCRIELCCDPPAAAADLAAHEEIPLDAAEKILASYQLLPRSIAVGPAGTSEHRLSLANRLLDNLVHHVREQTSVALAMAGHGISRSDQEP